MSSPTIEHPVSNPILSKSHLSPTRNHDFPAKFSQMSSRAKLDSKSGHPSLTPKNFSTYNMNESSYSPYYKGLLDQSLVIRSPQNLQQNDGSSSENQNQSPHFHASSPYYKGLLDQSLVISRRLASSADTLFHSHHIRNSLAEMWSPYYRGLLDQSLVLRARQFAENVPHSGPLSNNPIPAGSSSNSSILSMVPDFGIFFSSKRKEEIKNKIVSEARLKPGHSSSSPPRSNMIELKMKELNKNLGFAIEEEELRERGSEEIKEKTTMIELKMGLENKKKVSEYGLVGEEGKPLRESLFVSEIIVSETATKDEDLQKEKLIIDENDKRIEKKYTWAEKYQPKSLNDFICNKDIAIELQEMVSKGCGCEHFIFEGPPGVGKRCMIRALLGEVFGPDRIKVTEECRSFSLKEEMVGSIQVRIKKSAHHVEVNLSETKGYEKHVIVDLFKETYDKIINKSLPCSPDNCQAIILYEAEKLSIESILYIKWLLERHKGCNKVFFCCSNESKLQVVKPLCTTIHLSSPSSEKIADILEFIAKEEAIELSRDFAMKIVENSKNNLHQAIRSFEATWLNKLELKDDHIILTGWENDISNIAKSIIEEQSPKQLYNVHKKLQTLMIHNVPPDFIFKALLVELNILVDESLRLGIAKLNKEYNIFDGTKLGTKKQLGQSHQKQEDLEEKKSELIKKNATSYLQIEEFIAKFMSWYKKSSRKKDEYVPLST